MKQKTAVLICLLTAVLLAVLLVTVNRDLFRFTYDTLLEREFSPEKDLKQDYILTDPVTLKPGSYEFAPKISAEGNGSALFMVDGEDREIFYDELTDGTMDPVYPLEIPESPKQVRIGVRYDPESSAVRVERLRITADHILYKDSLLRHLTLSFLLVLAAVILDLRLCAPVLFRKIFPVFSKRENELAFGLLLLLTAASCYPLFDPGTYVRGEDMFFHLTRIKGLAESLRAGYFPVRDQLYWLRDYGYGVGFFYPDVFLYFPAALILLGFEVLTAYKVFLTVCSFFTVFSVWYAADRMSGSRTAAGAAAVLMAFAAYRLSNVYYRGTVGETQAAVFIPWIVLGLYEIFAGRPERWPLFAFGFWGLLGCHIISLTMTALLTALFLLTQIRRIFADRRILPALVRSVLLVLGLGAFFWIPMLEQSLTNPQLRVNNLMAGEVVLNKVNYAFPAANLFSRFKTWDYAYQADCIYPGWPLLAVPLLGLAVWKKRGRAVKAADFMLGFSVLLLWMCTRAFPWKWKIFLPFVVRIQFAYRLLLPATVLLCLCGGIYFAALVKERRPWIPLSALAVFCFFSTAFPVLQESVENRSYDKRGFVMQDNRVSGAEYLPEGLENDFPYRNGDTVLISDESVPLKVTAHKRQRLGFRFSYELPEDSGEVSFSLPLIYYTGFRGTLTGEDGTVRPARVTWDERGLVSVSSMGISRGTVNVSCGKTLPQRIGEAASLLTAAFCLAAGLRKRRKDPSGFSGSVSGEK